VSIAWSFLRLRKSQTVDQLAEELSHLQNHGMGARIIPWEALFDQPEIHLPVTRPFTPEETIKYNQESQ